MSLVADLNELQDAPGLGLRLGFKALLLGSDFFNNGGGRHRVGLEELGREVFEGSGTIHDLGTTETTRLAAFGVGQKKKGWRLI